jgi:hypothetical protein
VTKTTWPMIIDEGPGDSAVQRGEESCHEECDVNMHLRAWLLDGELMMNGLNDCMLRDAAVWYCTIKVIVQYRKCTT